MELIFANRAPSKVSKKVINLCITDLILRNSSVSVLFLYDKEINSQKFKVALQQVLTLYPLYSARINFNRKTPYLNCADQGMNFEFVTDVNSLSDYKKETLDHNNPTLINIVDPKRAVSDALPLFSVKLTQFSCGGMAIAYSWHHILGDMHTFMKMKHALSAMFNHEKSDKLVQPIITLDRDELLKKQLSNTQKLPTLRRLSFLEKLKYLFYFKTVVPKKESVDFHFNPEELANMQNELSKQSGKKLSLNDAICAHMAHVLLEIDPIKSERKVALAVNLRKRIGLAPYELGNYIDTADISVNIEQSKATVATNMHQTIKQVCQQNSAYGVNHQLLTQHGGFDNISQFLPTAFDPIRRNLLITSWAGFGVYDYTFNNSKPILFRPVTTTRPPWTASIVEGELNKGLTFNLTLPQKINSLMKQKVAFDLVHCYRD